MTFFSSSDRDNNSTSATVAITGSVIIPAAVHVPFRIGAEYCIAAHACVSWIAYSCLLVVVV